METIWFVLVAFMLTAYVVLDGFDLGAGALHLIAARTDDERRMLLRSIGPVWDGNEVWLLAAGGTLFYAFPLLYASSFSGFYLPLCIVLWLLVLRAIGIEYRAHLSNGLWRDFFDGVFSISSLLLLVLFGAALGNVMRGVPLGEDHYFFVPLWTDFLPGGPNPGALDWYTVLCALLTVAATTLHGALYVVLKTSGPLHARMHAIVKWLWPVVTVGTLAALPATMIVRPQVLDNYRNGPEGWVIPVTVMLALAGIFYFHRAGKERNAFLSSCAYLTATLAGAAFALYPVLLPGSDPRFSLTIANTAAGPQSLSIGLIWWSIGMAIAIGYFILVYRMFRGKVDTHSEGGH
jgi:cytochrome bd ubiquinol oxidase subunit II